MKTRFLALFFTGLLLVSCSVTKSSNEDLAINLPIETTINLVDIDDDRAPVTINPGRFTSKTVTYRLPRVIQGSYAVNNFGKYIDDFKAFDYEGNEMEVDKMDINSWVISNAKKLDKITYLVNDTFELEIVGGIGEDEPFSPAGINIDPNNFVLNLHGFIGYFDSLKNNQYKLDVIAAADVVRTSALQTVKSVSSEDGKNITTSYFAPRYFDITDNPMMYGDLDVEEFQVGDVKIVLSVYSPNKVHSAKALKETIYTMMQAQKTYLGDMNSTKRYDIYLFLSDGEENSAKGFGALEHHTSTVVVYDERMSPEELAESLINTVSHEFFHIVTPLGVHSEDVHYFDYNNPTFSKHLWMYEGVTEYFSYLFQVNQGLIDEAEFLREVLAKINQAKMHNDAMSFTIMSENVLKSPYDGEYYNVYQKGALIGMCIDILIREGSQGQSGILSLMKELNNKYGKDKPFEDDKLIDEIVAMTYPSLGEFFTDHIIGDIPINYNSFFEKVGLEIGIGKVETNYLIVNGVPIVSADPENGTIYFTEEVLENSFWVNLGVQEKDVIKSVDGINITMMNANTELQKVLVWEEGIDVEVVLDRNGKEIVIKTTTTTPYADGPGIVDIADVTDAQKALRNAWLKG
jgi:predicted metalloprotease with PDZ domain